MGVAVGAGVGVAVGAGAVVGVGAGAVVAVGTGAVVGASGSQAAATSAATRSSARAQRRRGVSHLAVRGMLAVPDADLPLCARWDFGGSIQADRGWESDWTRRPGFSVRRRSGPARPAPG